MAENDLLILPENTPIFPAQSPVTLPTWALARSAAESRQAGLDFGLPPSPFLYADLDQQASQDPRLTGYAVVFTPIPTPTGQDNAFSGPLRMGDQRVILISTPPPGGLPAPEESESVPLAVRRALVQSALQAGRQSGSAPVLILGGDLPQTAWGTQPCPLSDYLVDHPLICLLCA
jgi:hypothetical protein